MGEAVLHDPGQLAPLGRGRRSRDGLGHRPRRLLPGGRGQLDHAAEETLLRAAAQQHGAVLAPQPEQDPIAQRPFRFLGLPRQGVGNACRSRRAIPAPRAQHAARPARGTQHRAQIHQRLGEIAAAGFRHQRGGKRLQLRLCFGEGAVHGEEPRHHPLDIAIDGGRAVAEGDRGDRRRRIGADPRQRAQGFFVLGKFAAVPRHNRPRARPDRPGNGRHAARPRRARRHADCGRARNSRAPARDAAPRRARPRPVREYRESTPRIGQNSQRP